MKQVNLLTLALLLLSGLGVRSWGQETFPYNGVYDQREG